MAVLFTLDHLEASIENLGHDAALEMSLAFNLKISKHFGTVGGFSSRQSGNEIGIILSWFG